MVRSKRNLEIEWISRICIRSRCQTLLYVLWNRCVLYVIVLGKRCVIDFREMR